jgi:ligand-binding sensor domain-containing protein
VVNYSTQQYGKDKNPEIMCAVQDKRGVMYFGTGNGCWNLTVSNGILSKFKQALTFVPLAIDSTGVIYAGASG